MSSFEGVTNALDWTGQTLEQVGGAIGNGATVAVGAISNGLSTAGLR